VQARTRRDHGRDARRIARKRQAVVLAAGGGRGLAARAVLRDLEQVDLVDGEGLVERADQLGAELNGGTRSRRGARDAMQRSEGAVGAGA
jgi:hypothetical protein